MTFLTQFLPTHGASEDVWERMLSRSALACPERGGAHIACEHIPLDLHP